MTTADKAKVVVDVLRNREKLAHGRVIDARVKLAGNGAMRSAWEKEHRDDGVGGMDLNPYSSGQERLEAEATAAETGWKEAGEVLDFALQHFLAMLPDGGR